MNHFFYSDGQNQFGPFSKEELHSKGITKETLVWYEGLTEWIKAGESDEMKDLFPKIPTPPPLPKSITPPPIPKEETLTSSASIENSAFQPVKKKDFEPTETPISATKRNLEKSKSEKKSLRRTILIVSMILICVAILAVIIGVANKRNDNIVVNKSSHVTKATKKTKNLHLHSAVAQAKKIRSTTATLKGTLNIKSEDVLSYYFEYTQNGLTNTVPAIINGGELSARVSGLYANTRCEYCIVEKQNGGTIKTNSSIFTTLPPPVEIYAKVTTHTGRLFAALSFYNSKKKKIIAACDYRSNTVRSKAAEIASQTEGNFNIGQVCDIFDYCYDKWKYVNDPYRGELYQKASNTLLNGLTGDCDDFAILMASLLLSIGGDVRINVAYANDSGHAYTELNVGKTNMSIFADYILARYGITGNIWYRTDSKGNNWLNLDWQARHPGGEYYGGKRGARIYVIDEFVEEFSYR